MPSSIAKAIEDSLIFQPTETDWFHVGVERRERERERVGERGRERETVRIIVGIVRGYYKEISTTQHHA